PRPRAVLLHWSVCAACQARRGKVMLGRLSCAAFALAFAGTAALGADPGTIVSTKGGAKFLLNDGRVSLLNPPQAQFTRPPRTDAQLLTIFSNLAPKYPNGIYWCCNGWNIFGPTAQ